MAPGAGTDPLASSRITLAGVVEHPVGAELEAARAAHLAAVPAARFYIDYTDFAVWVLRVQRERMNAAFFPSAREYSRRYGLDDARFRTLPDHALVMHPGPMNRGMEIGDGVADSSRSVIVEQVANGVSVRMAVLYLLVGGSREDSPMGDSA